MIVAALAWVVGFGLASARAAMRLDRDGPVWFVFGAILGPVAVVLLHAAPPGLCRSCWRPTRGWPMVCMWCHEDVWATPQQTIATLARISARSTGLDQPTNPDHAPPNTQSQVARVANVIATTTTTTKDFISAPPRAWGPTAPEGDVARSSVNGSPAPIVRPASAESRHRGGLAPKAVEAKVLATAVYIMGSRSLESGRRYAIAIDESRLRILGPVDVDPSVVALDRIVAGVDATAIEGRLVVSEPGNRSGMVLAFMSVVGTSADDLANAIVDAARAAAHP